MPRKGGRNKENRRRDKNKGSGFQSCPGYVDENGIWNNGFQCPIWGDPLEKYCCGTENTRYCCPEPKTIKPTEPPPSHIPLIAGVAAGVFLIALVLVTCFACPCCPGGKFLHRTRKPRHKKGDKESEVHVQVCEHCNATISSTASPDSLACGCPVGAPPGSHSHHGSIPPQTVITGSQTIVNGGYEFQQDVDMVLTLYENPGAHVYTDGGEEMAKQMPCDEPPPYSENLMLSKQQQLQLQQQGLLEDGGHISPTAEDQNMIHRLPPPHMLCMKTFRPLDDPTLSPFASTILRHPRGEHNNLLMDQSRRDSGVLVEDQEQNTSQNHEESEEQDNYNESIVVPKFNFQSLNYVTKSGLHNSGSSGGLSQSRTSSGGLSNSKSRNRIHSRSSVESVELEHLDQLIESMNIHSNNVPPV